MAKAAFEAFYHANVKRIYAFVYFRVGGRKAVAEDLVQDIFLKAFEAYDRFDPERGASAWIYTIARNHIINSMAKERPGIDIEELSDSIVLSEDGRDRMELHDDERHLLDAISKLDPEDAKLVCMKHLEGWSYDDLADIFDKTSGTLRVQVSRAIKKLRNIL